jgi:hypothetical protein
MHCALVTVTGRTQKYATKFKKNITVCDRRRSVFLNQKAPPSVHFIRTSFLLLFFSSFLLLFYGLRAPQINFLFSNCEFHFVAATQPDFKLLNVALYLFFYFKQLV